MPPEHCGDELQEGDYVQGPGLCACRLAEEEEIEELEANGVALNV